MKSISSSVTGFASAYLGSRNTGIASGTRFRRGLSYVEVIVSIPLVAMVLVAALNTTGGVTRTWNKIQDQSRGPALAEQLMAEILQQCYQEPVDTIQFGRESGESGGDRTTWDDVDDYDEWTASPPKDKSGNSLANTTGWTRYVNVEKVSWATPTMTLNDNFPDQGVKRITVTVTDPAGKTTVLVAYRSQSGALEQSPLLGATFEGYVGHEMVIGAETLQGGANLPNHVEDQ